MSRSVQALALGPVAVGARSFVRGGERRLVAIVKATFEVVLDGPFRLAAPEPLGPDDLGLRLPAAQVFAHGASHAPPGSRVGVRLAVARGETMLVDQRCDIPTGAPSSFGGIPRLAPKRRALLGSCPPSVADESPDLVLPDDFDEAYFLTAPPEQCVRGAWTGGELVALVHLHPQYPTIRTYLPRGYAAALLQTQRGVRLPIRLRCDTIVLHPETLRAELVFRGDVRVDEEALREARMAGAWSEGGEVEFPDLAELPLAGRPWPPPASSSLPVEEATPSTVRFELPEEPPARRRGQDATLVLEAPEPEPLPRRARAGTMVLSPEAAEPEPLTVDGGAVARMALPDLEEETTHDVSAPRSLPFDRSAAVAADDATEPAPRAALPGAPWAEEVAEPPPRARADLASTMVLEVSASEAPPKPAALPFAEPARVPPPERVAPAAVELSAPPPMGSSAPPSGAAAEPPAAAVTSAPPPAAALSAPPAPPAPEKATEAKNPWREDPAPEAVAAPPKPGRPPRERISFRSDLYKKFKK